MKYIYLGQTRLYVSRIALGLWDAGGDWGAVDEATETATIRRALESGINFLVLPAKTGKPYKCVAHARKPCQRPASEIRPRRKPGIYAGDRTYVQAGGSRPALRAARSALKNKA